MAFIFHGIVKACQNSQEHIPEAESRKKKVAGGSQCYGGELPAQMFRYGLLTCLS